MAQTLASATSKMQSVITGNLPLAKSAEPPSAFANASAAFNVAAVGFVVNKVKSVVTDSMNTLVDGLSEGFHRMKSIVLDTVAAFRPFEVEMFNRAVMDLKAVFGTMFLPILQQVTKLVRELADYFYSLPQAFKDTIAGIAKWTLILGGLATVVGALLGVTEALVIILTPVAMAFGMLVSLLTPLIVVMAPLVVVFGAVAAGLAILTGAFAAVAGVLIYQNWGKIVTTFEQIWAAIEAVAQAVWSQLAPVWKELKGAFVELGAQLGELFDAFKPLLGAALLGAAVVIKTVLSAIIEGVTFFVQVLTGLAMRLNSAIRSLGLPGFSMPDMSRPEQSAFGLGQHGGSVTDPLSAFKSMQEEILKFSGKAEAEKPPIDQVAEYSKRTAESMDFIVQAIKNGLTGQNEGESNAHALLRKGPFRFAAGKIAGKLF